MSVFEFNASVDVFCANTNTNTPPPPNKPGLNLEFAEALKEEAGIAEAPVGQISDPEHLRSVAERSTMYAVIIGRAFLPDP